MVDSTVSRYSRKVISHWLFFLVIILINTAALYNAFQKPLSMDEAEMAFEARHLYLTGIYHQEGMTHPPLYIHILSLFSWLFGLSGSRVFSWIMFYINFILLVLLCKTIVEDKFDRRIIYLCYFILPIFLTQSMLATADTTVLPFFVLLFFIAMFRLKSAVLVVIVPAILFCLMLWTKLLPSAWFPLCLIVLYMIKNDVRRAVFSIYSAVIGAVMFVTSWTVYSYVNHVSFYVFFADVFNRSVGTAMVRYNLHHVRQVVYTLIWDVNWVTVSLVILAILAVIYRIKRFLKERTVSDIDALLIVAIATFSFFDVLFAPGPTVNYKYSAILLFIVFVISEVSKIKIGWDISRKRLIIASILLGLISFVASLLHIYPYGSIHTDYLPDDILNQHISQIRFAFVPIFISVFLVAFCLYSHNEKELRYLAVIATCAFILYLTFNIDVLYATQYLDVVRISGILCIPILFFGVFAAFEYNWTAVIVPTLIFSVLACGVLYGFTVSRSDYNTGVNWANYGERGLSDTISYLHSHISKTDRIVARKDVYVPLLSDDEISNMSYWDFGDRRFDDRGNYSVSADMIMKRFTGLDGNYITAKDSDINMLRTIFINNQVKYVVLDMYSNILSNDTRFSDYSVDKKFGDFTILRRNVDGTVYNNTNT